METQKIIVGNLKSYMDINDVSNYLKIINEEVVDKRVIICPSNIYIPYFLKQRYEVGLQNIFINEEGPYTGEITPSQASSIGINYVIIGHSERRLHLNETNNLISKKVLSALKNNMKVILCVGETIEEKQLLKTDQVIRKQLVVALNSLTKDMLDNVIIAYEPVWAIGSNKVADYNDIKQTSKYIKMVVEQITNYSNIKVLYGGSVNETNIKELNKIENIYGFLIGGASTKADVFLKIINEVIAKQ